MFFKKLMMMFIKYKNLNSQRFETQHSKSMFSSRNTPIWNKNVGKPQHQILRLIIFLSLSQLVFNAGAVNSELPNEASNLLVVKNNKIAFIKMDNLMAETKDTVNQKVWITNTQEAFKIEVFEEQITNPQYFAKLSQSLPLLSTNLQTKSYIKPLTFSFLSGQDNSNTPLLRGYKYFKPSFTTGEDNMLEEIGQFLKVVIKQNNLGYLSLRLQDSFNIQLIMSTPNHTETNNSFIVTSFNIKYLFPTVQHTNIPSQVLSILTVKTLQQHLSSHNHQTLERKLSGKGLHMMINLTLILDDKTDIEIQSIKDSCWIKFTDVLPETTYVDADQRRQEITNYETINVQKPAFDSKQYFYSYKVPLNQFHQVGVNKYLYQQPIHFRYPLPSSLNYTKVYLHPIQQAMIICLSNSDYQQNKEAGSQTDSQRYNIYEVEENALFDRGTAKIPNGDISKTKIVSIVTLGVCLVAVMMIISRLKKF